MDKSWMGTDRHKKPYIDGVATFLDYVVRNDNILPRVDPLDLRKESCNDYFRTDCPGIVIHKHMRILDPGVISRGNYNHSIKFRSIFGLFINMTIGQRYFSQYVQLVFTTPVTSFHIPFNLSKFMH
ncbi:hypothetical protein Lser_V15G33632 [Lactuca serriola]